MERVKRGERYWYFEYEEGVGYKIDFNYENFDPLDNYNFEEGNYFHTKEEAERVAKKLRAVLKGAEVVTPTEKKFKECLANVPNYDRGYTAGVMDTLAKFSKYEDELDAATEIYHQKGYSDGEYCHEQSFAWGFQEGIDWLKSKLTKEDGE